MPYVLRNRANRPLDTLATGSPLRLPAMGVTDEIEDDDFAKLMAKDEHIKLLHDAEIVTSEFIEPEEEE